MKFWNSQRTLLSEFLTLLNVKHTQYADKLYNEHPYKYSLYGLSQMLFEYKIENIALQVEDKNMDLDEIAIPFIAHLDNGFMVVYGKRENRLLCWWKGQRIKIKTEEFKSIWSGNILLAESDLNSIEPDYKLHYMMECLERLKAIMLVSLLLGLFIIKGVENNLFFDLGVILSILFNIIGVYICWLLLKKQMHQQNSSADKLCSLFKTNCNRLLDLKGTILWGTLTWSELGFGYFVSNLLVLFFFPALKVYLAYLGYLALLFSLWSIWFQKIKMKQWCILCLIVQVLFGILAVVYSLFGFVEFTVYFDFQLLYMAFIYFFSPLLTNVVCKWLELKNQNQNLRQQMRELKMKDEIAQVLFREQINYEVTFDDSLILFGNPKASIKLTVLTNPHCEPCAIMHQRIERLLEKVWDKICVQYIFTAFNETLDRDCECLIAYYLNHSMKESLNFYHKWFLGGKYHKDIFFQKHMKNIENEEAKCEYEKHLSWRRKNNLVSTPIVLINGYLFPSEYKLEDIIYFVGISN